MEIRKNGKKGLQGGHLGYCRCARLIALASIRICEERFAFLAAWNYKFITLFEQVILIDVFQNSPFSKSHRVYLSLLKGLVIAMRSPFITGIH